MRRGRKFLTPFERVRCTDSNLTTLITIVIRSRQLLHPKLSYDVLGCVFEVYRQLGAGFAETVYARALLIELHTRGLRAEPEVSLRVGYKGKPVGRFVADIVVGGKIILELKACRQTPKHAEAQLINYLKASGMRLGLLINFRHPAASVKRIAF